MIPSIRVMFCVGLLAGLSTVSAQQSPLAEYRGTWTLDESAVGARADVARTLIISMTPDEITVTKDSRPSEVYRIDGTELRTRDLRAGAPIEHRYSLLVIADRLELTIKTKQESITPALTHIATDAYRVTRNTLTVGRQRDVLTVEREGITPPPPRLEGFAALANYRQMLVYRRR